MVSPAEEDKGTNIGELFVKGPGVFKEYFDNPGATAGTFSEDGWFKTGDIAKRLDDGTYKILGRSSVDIIKSGGYKISALEIERDLLSNPSIVEAVVVGIADDTWGQKIYAMVVKKDKNDPLTADQLTEWLRGHLAPYKLPRKIIFVSEIPRNVMGKVNKKELIKHPLLQ